MDLNRLRLPNKIVARAETRPHPPRHKPGQKFLKGPIPWDWLCVAACLSGKALHVGMAIWLKVGIIRRREVKLSRMDLEPLGVRKDAASRALRSLEEAGLVSVERHPGQSPAVTLLDGPTA